MRWIPAAIALSIALAACLQNQNGGSSSTGDAGLNPCDGKKNCSMCLTCAQQNACRDELDACNGSSACQGIIQCVNATCGGTPTTSCEGNCKASNTDGAATYDALIQCGYCSTCASDCAGFRTCN
jgi:hypothetical protein